MYYLGLAARLLLVLVFASAVLGKTWRRTSFVSFADSVEALRVLPRHLARPAAVLTVVLEGAVAVLLCVPALAVVGLVLAMLLLLSFVAGILAARRAGRLVPCRCFGATRKPLGMPHVIRNLLLVAAAALALLGQLTPGSAGVHLGGVAIAVAVAGIAALIVVRLDDLLSLGPLLR
ncbi:MauE/DoxX family redox-associated membrane protein [Streptomyces sp. T-3]|nr:MauE/DoxX family redox-associated membrane protein [Streptomyces sp. T-3]